MEVRNRGPEIKWSKNELFDTFAETVPYRLFAGQHAHLLGEEKTLYRFFESIQLQIYIENEDFSQHEGATPEDLKEHWNDLLSIFKQQCIGIDTQQPYKIQLDKVRIDRWRVSQLALAIMLFVCAGKISQYALFCYTCITGVASRYRWEPPMNQPSKNIMKWILLLMALPLVYFSSCSEEASDVIIALTLVLSYFPECVWCKLRANRRQKVL